MKHYIYDLYASKKLKRLEMEFEEKFSCKAIFAVAPCQTQMRLVVTDYLFHFVNAYTFKDFECHPWQSSPFGYEELPKSLKKINNDEVINFYFDFMKRNFPEYEQDYLEQIEQECLEN